MPFSQLKQIPFCITSVLQGLRLYPAEHPQIHQQLETSVDTLTSLFKQQPQLTIGLIDDTLLVNDIPCLEQLPPLEELARLFDRQQLQTVEILPGIDCRQLLIFCQELPQILGGDFSARLEQLGVTAIRALPLEDELNGPQFVYKKALKTIEEVFNDVRLGRIPSSRKTIKTVKGMVQSILDEPYALLAMSMLKDYDNYTFCHSVNVAVIAMSVGKACGLTNQELYELGLGGLLHDLGKMTIDHQIVAKPGKLSATEIEEMKRHPGNGAKIVAEMEQIPASAIEIVNSHHLRYDRTGYPADCRGNQVSPLADMICIADTYDAMTSMRCYQRPRSPRQAIERMKKLSGTHLHPRYLEKFLNYLGPYPVGTLVRLKNSSIGLVCDQNRQGSASLTLKIIFAYDGQRHADPPIVQLPDDKKIVAEVDPALKGVRLEAYLP